MIARLVISPSPDDIKKEINKTIPKVNHPDVLYFPSDAKLGISEARKIKEHFSLKPYSLKGRITVLENAPNLTLEAQNALLKTFEELPENALILMGANSDASFLPTVLSRCEVIRLKGQGNNEGENDDIEKLVKSSLEEKFEYIEKLKDKEELLHSLVSYFHKKEHSFDFLKKLLQAEGWASQNVNMRAILEYLMLVMPKE